MYKHSEKNVKTLKTCKPNAMNEMLMYLTLSHIKTEHTKSLDARLIVYLI